MIKLSHLRNINFVLLLAVQMCISTFSVSASQRVADFGINSLMYAVSENDYGLADSLIWNGIDVNARSDLGWTALWFAKTPEMLRYLAEKGIDVTVVDKMGQTVLAKIAMDDEAPNPKLKTLVELGADINSRGANELTPLMEASRNVQDIEVLFFLFFLGADINARDNWGRTTLMHAVNASPVRTIMAEKRNNLKIEETLKALIMLGAIVNLRDNEGMTALSLAAAKGGNWRRLTTMQFLVEQGADIHCLSNQGESVLIFLCRSFLEASKHKNNAYLDRQKTIKDEIAFLLECGVDPKFKDKEGKTYLDYLEAVEDLSANKTEKIMKEYRVINALVCHEFSESISNNIPLVIRNKLCVNDGLIKYSTKEGTLLAYVRSLAEEAASLDQGIVEAVWDFYAKNSGEWDFNSVGELSVNHIVMTKQKERSIFHEKGRAEENWKVFYAEYPSSAGIIDFSRVGFSRDDTISVIYMGNLRGRLEGGGGIYIYKKVDGEWVPSEYSIGRRWIS